MTRQTLVLLLGWFLVFNLSVLPSFSEDLSPEDCLACHSDKDLEAETERGKGLKLFVPEEALKGSIHEDLSCTDCHTGAQDFEEIPHSPKPLTMNCISCHDDAGDEVGSGNHGKAAKAGNTKAPSCSDCHGGHRIMPLDSPGSILSKKNQAETCGKCHNGSELQMASGHITKKDLVTRYKSSIHWQAILEGKNAATCSDCHGSHNILSSEAQASGVSRSSVADSCRKCHEEQSKAYWTGVHGEALLGGNHDVPTCTTCHGDHDMATLKGRSGDARQYASTQVCMWCHGNSRMMARYGLDTQPVDTYLTDFHGLTQRGTLGASATCADCHDPHLSLKADHPKAWTNPDNRANTCAKCHGEVSNSFAMSFSHSKAEPGSGTRVEEIVRIVYTLIIIFAVGGMFFYTFLIWFKAVRDKIKRQRKEKHIRRMSRFERVSHALLFTSFFALVITGFALKYPEAFWVKWLFAIGIDEAVRSSLHRISAVIMTLDLGFFFGYMLFRKRGTYIRREIMPRKKDIKEFISNLKYYLGRSKEAHPPKHGVFGFADKVEFWALVWGTVVMFISGLILWFPKAIPEDWPGWVINVARVIHYYEAILATLAIIIWHGFHVIFHPGEYPMNTSWLTGYITRPDAKEHYSEEAIRKMKIKKKD